MQTALYWEKYNNKVRCLLCPHNCIIAKGQSGICKVRINVDGQLVSSIYGEVTSLALDPIEKKPLYHFHPGSAILSIGTNGCNLACQFCQNWQFSQTGDSGRQKITSEEIIKEALRVGSVGIAYTYNEPFIWYEFVLETAIKAKKAGLKNVLVTNGYVNNEPLVELLPFIDAMNIDLKSFKKGFYKDICNGDVSHVKNNIISAFKKCHIEITNLIIPSKNDTVAELEELAGWVASISPFIPVHLSRYFANYKMKIDPTAVLSLQKARDVLLKQLKYVYIGNVNIENNSNTYCPGCDKLLIDRTNYAVKSIKVVDGKCKYCGNAINGVFNEQRQKP